MSERYPSQTYACGDCGQRGVKLWREYNTFLSHQVLRCLFCSAKVQKKTLRVVDKHGRSDCHRKMLGSEDRLGDQIGWLIPAVPTRLPDLDGFIGDDGTYWGYTSVETNLEWWYDLPIVNWS